MYTEMHPLLWMICSEPEMGQAMVGSGKLRGEETLKDLKALFELDHAWSSS